jgi:hypothetical protein
MADSSYRRYGINAGNPMMGLVAGQNAVNNSLNSALDSVGDLLQQQEARAVDTNTVNMQDYLQKKLAVQGLGAEPIDMIGIKKKFGDNINMDALKQTEQDKRNLLVKDAINSAGASALNNYSDSKDIAKAGDVFRQNLIDAGMGSMDADEKTAAWRAANQYRDTDAKTELADRTNIMKSALGKSWAAGGDDSSIDKYVIDNFSEKERPAAREAAKNYYQQLSQLDEQDKSDYTDLQTRLSTAAKIAQTQYDDEIAGLEGQLSAIDSISPENQALADAAFGTLGGDAAFGEDGEFKESLPAAALNSVFQIGTGTKSGPEARTFLQDSISGMTRQGIPRKEAIAIAIQSYNASKEKGQDWNIGNGIAPTAYNAVANQMIKNSANRRQLSSQLANAQSKRSLGMAEQLKRNDSLLRKFKQELRGENLGQGEFDQSSYFADRAPTTRTGKSTQQPTKTAAANTNKQAPPQSSYQQLMSGGQGGTPAGGDTSKVALDNILNAGASKTAKGEGTVPGVGFNAPSSKVNPPKEEIPAKDIEIDSYDPASDGMSDGQTIIFNKYKNEINDPNTSSKRKKYLTSWLQKEIADQRDKVAKEEKRIKDQVTRYAKPSTEKINLGWD